MKHRDATVSVDPLPGATGDRILAALWLTRRPLRSAELASALALDERQSLNACRRLVLQGYIRNVGAEPAWSLSDKGRALRGQG
jgi:hypothetical protein